MRRILSLIIVFITLNVSASNLYDYNGKGYCQDFAGILSQRNVSIINATLTRIEKESSIEISTVAIPTLNGDDIENYANKLFNHWGIGKTTNNGVLFIIAINEHKSRIEVGRGLEPYLTDYKCKQILEQIKPYLRSKDYNGAFNYVINSVTAIIQEAKEENDVTYKAQNVTTVVPLMTGAKNKPSEPIDWSTFIQILLILCIIGVIVYIIYQVIIYYRNFKEKLENNMTLLTSKYNFLKDKFQYIENTNSKLDKKYGTGPAVDKANISLLAYESSYLLLKHTADNLKYFPSKSNDDFFATLNNTIDNMSDTYKTFLDLETVLTEITDKIKREKDAEKLQNELLIRARTLLRDYSLQYLNDKYVENKNEFETISNDVFIKKPNYAKYVEDIQLTVKTIHDAMLLPDYTKGIFNKDLLKFIETLESNIQIVGTTLYNAKALLKDTEIAIKNITADYNNSKNEIYYNTTDVRRQIDASNIDLYNYILKDFEDKKFKACNDNIRALRLNLKYIKDDYKAELEIKNVKKDIQNSTTKCEKLIDNKSFRINYLNESSSLYKTAKVLEEADMYVEALDKYNAALVCLTNIENDYIKEQKEIKRKEEERLRKIREAEEEERRRKKREEDEEDDRRRRNSYSSSSNNDYSSSSSSISFGGGESGGGGASSDF